MASITPKGSASVGNGDSPLSFPLMPQAWPLTTGAGNGEVQSTQPQQAAGAGAAHVTALAQSGNSNNRLV